MAMVPAAPYWTSAYSAPAFWEATAKLATLATAYQTDKAFSLFHRTCEIGCAQVSHYMTADAGFYVLEGNVTMNVEGLDHNTPLYAGQYITVPRFTALSYVAANHTTLLEFYTPGGAEGLVSGIWQPAFPSQSRPVEQTNAPAAYVSALDRQFGAVFFPPTSTASSASPTNQAAIAAVMDFPSPGITNATTAPSFWIQPEIPELWTVLAGSRQTRNMYTLTQKTYSQGVSSSPSRNTLTDSSYYVLKGTASLLLDNQVVSLSKDQFAFVPKGTVFSLKTSEDFTALVFDFPSGLVERSLSILGAVPAKEQRLPTAGEVTAANTTDPRVLLEMKASMRIISVNATAALRFL